MSQIYSYIYNFKNKYFEYFFDFRFQNLTSKVGCIYARNLHLAIIYLYQEINFFKKKADNNCVSSCNEKQT